MRSAEIFRHCRPPGEAADVVLVVLRRLRTCSSQWSPGDSVHVPRQLRHAPFFRKNINPSSFHTAKDPLPCAHRSILSYLGTALVLPAIEVFVYGWPHFGYVERHCGSLRYLYRKRRKVLSSRFFNQRALAFPGGGGAVGGGGQSPPASPSKTGGGAAPATNPASQHYLDPTEKEPIVFIHGGSCWDIYNHPRQQGSFLGVFLLRRSAVAEPEEDEYFQKG